MSLYRTVTSTLFLLLRIIFNIFSWCSGSCSMTKVCTEENILKMLLIPNFVLFLKSLTWLY